MTTAAEPSNKAAIIGCGALRSFPVIDQVERIAQPPTAGANVLSRWPCWRCRIGCGRCRLARRTRSIKSVPVPVLPIRLVFIMGGCPVLILQMRVMGGGFCSREDSMFITCGGVVLWL